MIPVLTEESQAMRIIHAIGQAGAETEKTESQKPPQSTKRVIITKVTDLPLKNFPTSFSRVYGKKYSCEIEDSTGQAPRPVRLTDGIYEALTNSWPIYATQEVVEMAGVTEKDLRQSGFSTQEELEKWFQNLPPSSCHRA